jgi:dipeptidase
MIARNDDSGGGSYTSKKFVMVSPADQPRHYKSVISHVEIDLPDDPMRYSAMPNAEKGEGIWAAAGINAANVAMTATETITSNARVLGADPLVVYHKKTDTEEEKIGGIGEEDLVVLVLPYIHTAREGVERLGSLLKQYGTYENNGIAFADGDEIWWLETIGGHHWMARRVRDEEYVVMPNQLGIDSFSFDDAYGEKKEYMCSDDLKEFMEKNHLDVSQDEFDPRGTFGSHDDADHVYNTPRAWYMLRYFNPNTYLWDGPEADYRPMDDDLPWAMVPEKKITPEDIKYVLSSHYQGTPFDPYGHGREAGMFRSIGINRTDFMGLLQIRNDVDEAYRAVEWIAEGSNAFNVMAPFYTNVSRTPDYLASTTGRVSTDSFYWSSRLIGALADASYGKSQNLIERYTLAVGAQAHEIICRYDEKLKGKSGKEAEALCEAANEEMAAMLKKETDRTLYKVLYEASNHMRNSYNRSDH